jgi:predicted DsbA family dithiol-disulfide isomerase
MGEELAIEWRAFPLRPQPDPSATFRGTYREEGWRRCGAMSAPDGIRFVPWARDDYPDWSVPALEAAKCVALQGEGAFERLHLELYRAFFERGINIAKPAELIGVVEESGADMRRFRADLETGVGRAAVGREFERALTEDRVRAIPTVIVSGGARLTGLADIGEYRKAIEAGERL